MGASFFNRCRWGVAQYVLVRISCSVAYVILDSVGKTEEGSWKPSEPSLWFTVAINISQCWALYCLIFFVSVLWPALKPMQPLPKFLLVKIVVFGFWWQQLFLQFLSSFSLFDALGGPADSPKADYDSATILQDVLITMEALFIALLYHFVYGLTDFLRPEMQEALHKNTLPQRWDTDVVVSPLPSPSSPGFKGDTFVGENLDWGGKGGVEEEKGLRGNGEVSDGGGWPVVKVVDSSPERGTPPHPRGKPPLAHASSSRDSGGGMLEGTASSPQTQTLSGKTSPGGAVVGEDRGASGSTPHPQDSGTPHLLGQQQPERGMPGALADLFMLDVASETADVIKGVGTAVVSGVKALAAGGKVALGGSPRKSALASEEGFLVSPEKSGVLL